MMISRTCAHRILGCVVVGVTLQLIVALFYMFSPDWLPGMTQVSTYRQRPRSMDELALDAQQLYRERHREDDGDDGGGGGGGGEQPAEPFQPQDEELYPRRWPIPTVPGVPPAEWLALQNNTGECSQCPFKERNGIFCLQDDDKTYMRTLGNLTCLIEGTDWNSTSSSSISCLCRPGWHGAACSLPWALFFSDMSMQYKQNLTVRAKPRRIIHAFPFNMEFDMLEARIAEFGDLIDVFMILESNFTAYGEPRSLQLLPRLQQGAFSDIACKIVYVFLDHYPEKAYHNGWLADHLHRDYIGSQGLAKQLKSYRHDDIFLLTDADEIPARDTLLFLKLHDGYPESFGYYYQWNVYGYFWAPGGASHFDAGMTMGMLSHVMGLHNAMTVRYCSSKLYMFDRALNTYMRAGGIVSPWNFGDEQTYAGWHCSWCFKPEGIRTKLTSAINADFPRWGDYPEKVKLDYIESLIKKGMWFDDQQMFYSTDSSVPKYAPAYVLQHREQYQYVLENPYKTM